VLESLTSSLGFIKTGAYGSYCSNLNIERFRASVNYCVFCVSSAAAVCESCVLQRVYIVLIQRGLRWCSYGLMICDFCIKFVFFSFNILAASNEVHT